MRPIPTLSLMFAVAFGSAMSPALAQEIFRWVDANGQVHYGDQPPANAERVRTQRGVDAAPPPVARPPRSAEEQERAQQRCQEALEELAEYRAAGVINERDALGNERALSDEEREQLLGRMAADADRVCDEL